MGNLSAKQANEVVEAYITALTTSEEGNLSRLSPAQKEQLATNIRALQSTVKASIVNAWNGINVLPPSDETGVLSAASAQPNTTPEDKRNPELRVAPLNMISQNVQRVMAWAATNPAINQEVSNILSQSNDPALQEVGKQIGGIGNQQSATATAPHPAPQQTNDTETTPSLSTGEQAIRHRQSTENLRKKHAGNDAPGNQKLVTTLIRLNPMQLRIFLNNQNNKEALSTLTPEDVKSIKEGWERITRGNQNTVNTLSTILEEAMQRHPTLAKREDTSLKPGPLSGNDNPEKTAQQIQEMANTVPQKAKDLMTVAGTPNHPLRQQFGTPTGDVASQNGSPETVLKDAFENVESLLVKYGVTAPSIRTDIPSEMTTGSETLNIPREQKLIPEMVANLPSTSAFQNSIIQVADSLQNLPFISADSQPNPEEIKKIQDIGNKALEQVDNIHGPFSRLYALSTELSTVLDSGKDLTREHYARIENVMTEIRENETFLRQRMQITGWGNEANSFFDALNEQLNAIEKQARTFGLEQQPGAQRSSDQKIPSIQNRQQASPQFNR
ncbi:MAG: hypothetical protein H6908_02745 [Hyphomicrobiales bacterium]|nr:hypothetical protein [Hyphomicrobiales bacterium]